MLGVGCIDISYNKTQLAESQNIIMESLKTQQSQQRSDFSDDSSQCRVITPFQFECQQALLRKQRRARNCLLQLDVLWNHSDCSKRDSSINGWIDPISQQSNHDFQHKSTSQTINLRERSVTQTSNLIPTLKQELCRLESPERKKRDKVSGSRLFQLQVISELNRKRKHTMRVSEIIRCRESKLLMTNAFRKEERPLTNAAPRLNQHKVRKLKPTDTEPSAIYERLFSQQISRDQFFKQNQVKHVLRKKTSQMSSFLKTSKDFNLTKLDQARISKNLFYQERKKEKVTLKNLLDL